MKSFFIILTLSILAYLPGIAQQKLFSFTAYTGYSPQQRPQIANLLMNRDLPMDEFEFNLIEVAPQIHFGIRKNIPFQRPFFGTVGVEYTQQHHTFSCTLTHPAGPQESDNKITFSGKSLLLPAGIGVRLGHLEITNGMLVQYNFQSKLSGENTMGIEATKSDTSFGWYSGIGINLGNTSIGISYQSSLNRDGSNLIHRGKSMELMSVPGNFMFTIGFSL